MKGLFCRLLANLANFSSFCCMIGPCSLGCLRYVLGISFVYVLVSWWLSSLYSKPVSISNIGKYMATNTAPMIIPITTSSTFFLPNMICPAATSSATYVNPLTVVDGFFRRHDYLLFYYYPTVKKELIKHPYIMSSIFHIRKPDTIYTLVYCACAILNIEINY